MTDTQLLDTIEKYRINLKSDARVWDPCGLMGYLGEVSSAGFGEPVKGRTVREVILRVVERLKETEHLWNRTGRPHNF